MPLVQRLLLVLALAVTAGLIDDQLRANGAREAAAAAAATGTVPPADSPATAEGPLRWLTSWSNPRAEAVSILLLGFCLICTVRLRRTPAGRAEAAQADSRWAASKTAA